MHRFIPFAVELLESIAVPPVLIKLAMVQPAQFCEKIAHILENKVKAEDNDSSTRQHQSKHQLDQIYLAAFLYPRLNIL